VGYRTHWYPLNQGGQFEVQKVETQNGLQKFGQISMKTDASESCGAQLSHLLSLKFASGVNNVLRLILYLRERPLTTLEKFD